MSAEEQEAAEQAAAEAATKAARANHSTSSTGIILKRAKEAEKEVKLLKKQLKTLATQKSGLGTSEIGGGMKGVDNAAKDIEIRRLQRRIKRFEESGSSSSSGGGGGGGGTAADDKAIKDLQKKLVSEGKAAAKKYRDLEIKTKKEYKSLEAKASKDAKALSKANAELLPVRAERDQLKKRVTDLMNLGVEVGPCGKWPQRPPAGKAIARG